MDSYLYVQKKNKIVWIHVLVLIVVVIVVINFLVFLEIFLQSLYYFMPFVTDFNWACFCHSFFSFIFGSSYFIKSLSSVFNLCSNSASDPQSFSCFCFFFFGLLLCLEIMFCTLCDYVLYFSFENLQKNIALF